MLYLVLVLVLAAFGLLITALVTANTVWAWVSVTVSVVAAALLVYDWLGGRRRGAAAPPLLDATAPGEPTRTGPPAVPDRPAALDDPTDWADTPAGLADHPPERASGAQDRLAAEPAEQLERPVEPPLVRHFEREPDLLAGAPPARTAAEPAHQSVPHEEPGEPAEESTDATDLLVVSDLRAEVRVVDEHPRYHLATCTWLIDKPTLPLPVAEARQLGFTPCARCGPDATLAAQHRASR